MNHRYNLFHLLGVFLIVAIGVWMYYPALGLPRSLIDDYAQLHNMENWLSNYSTGGFWSALKLDISFSQRIYNTGFWLLTVGEYYINGGNPFHWLKLMELVYVSVLIYKLVRRISPMGRYSCAGALLAVFLFLVGEVPGAVDMQSLRANWYRLFTSDSDGLVFLATHIYCLVSLTREQTRPRVCLWGIGAVTTAVAALSIKITLLAVIGGSLSCVVLVALICREYRFARIYGIVLGTITILAIAYLMAFRYIAGSSDRAGYSSGYSPTPAQILSGIKYYGTAYWNMLGPILPAFCLCLLIQLIRLWRNRFDNNSSKFAIYIYMCGFTACAIAVYIPWEHQLPRYMLVGWFGMVILIGVVASSVLADLNQAWKKNKWLLLFVPIGTGCAFLPPWFFLIVLCMVGGATILKKTYITSSFATGVGLTGLAFLISITPYTRSAMDNLYIGSEVAGWKATLAVLRMSAKEQTVYFAGNTSDEHIGSMMGHIQHLGVKPHIKPITDAGYRTSASVVLINKWLFPESRKTVVDLPMLQDFKLDKSQFKVPIDYWQFRDRLFDSNENSLISNTWTVDYAWRLVGSID